MAKDQVLIVGAGLAGLACALEFKEKQIPFQIIEASDGVGGRVRTDEHEGFLLDRGFQVYLTAYPEGLRLLDYASLDLRAFKAGAQIRLAGDFERFVDPWRVKSMALAMLFSGVASLGDKLKMRSLRKRLLASTEEAILERPNRSTLGLLKIEGFSTQIIDRFFRPFLGGIMLETSLVQSSRIFEFVFKMLADGDAAVPARGMGEIPRQLAARLPEGSIRLNARVAALHSAGVTLEDGEAISGSGVVLACEGPEASRLAPAVPLHRWRSVACLYYELPAPPLEGPWLVLNGNGQWPINNLAVMSEVSSSYAPDGKSLLSISVLGRKSASDAELKSAVDTQLERWWGRETRHWKHLRTYRINQAQPDLTPEPLTERTWRLKPGLYVAGDHTIMPSIHYAMVSGKLAASDVIADLAGHPAPAAA